jgi:hypothetical protein
MNLRSTSHWGALAMTVVVAFACLFTFGQHRINRQVGQPVYGGSGGGGGGGSVRYGYVAPTAPHSANLLPSEARNAYYRSGALPSEIRMNVRAVGPMAPGGVSAYIPPGSPVVIRAGNAPQGNLVNPMAARPNNNPVGTSFSPSVRYNGPTNQVAWSQPMAGSVPAQSFAGASGNPFGTVHYPNSR